MSLLLTLAWTSVSFGPGPGNKPIVSCESLGTAALGPNVTVISAELVKTAIEASAAGETCTYEDNVDVGDPSTIVAHTPGLVDRKKCCALCFANSECGVAAVLPASYGQNVGCWLKTGAGERAKKPGVTVCRTNRPPPAPPPGTPTSYCLVKVLVQPAINIWVTLPADGSYNDRFMALGGGGFVGSVSVPKSGAYAGATTDTGHVGSSGSFGMLKPGVPNTGLQADFGWRSEHMMAVVSKLLIGIYYGKPPSFSYWNGCSTGGRQGQAMAQRFPEDYDGVLTGAPAIHFEKLGLGQTWPQVPMLMENGNAAIPAALLAMATEAAIAACDMLDGVQDKELRDPRACNYSAAALVGKGGGMTAAQAKAIDMIWHGSTNVDGSLSWYGIPRGAAFDALAGESLMSIPAGQAKYWVELDPDWDYHTLNYENYPAFFDKTVKTMEPGPTATDNPESISVFRDRGGKVIMWHGWADQIIMPQGSIDYYNQVIKVSDKGNLTATQAWFRLFMAPGVAHCGMSNDPYFEALVQWVEHGVAPASIIHDSPFRSRPLCPHPTVAVYSGDGSTNAAANFHCGENLPSLAVDTEDCDARVNQRLFGMPFVPSAPCPDC